MDILPDIQLGPVGDGKHPDALALGLAGIVEMPEFRALVFRVPAMVGGAEREDALLGTGFLLIAAGAAESSVEAVMVQRLFQPFASGF
jgi:hypothetical protein